MRSDHLSLIFAVEKMRRTPLFTWIFPSFSQENVFMRSKIASHNLLLILTTEKNSGKNVQFEFWDLAV